MSGKIHELMPLVMKAIGPITKDGKVGGTGPNYKYRSIDHVLACVQPVLVEHGISTSMNVDEIIATSAQEAKSGGGVRTLSRTVCRVTITFTATDGSSKNCSAVGEGVDFSGDKASSKAMSAGLKYAIGHGLCIPFEDAADSDRDTPTEDAEPKKVNVLAAANESAPSGSVPFVETTKVDVNTTCQPHQQDEVKRLAALMQMPIESLKAAIAKRGANRLAELSVAQCNELLDAMRRKLQAENIPF